MKYFYSIFLILLLSIFLFPKFSYATLCYTVDSGGSSNVNGNYNDSGLTNNGQIIYTNAYYDLMYTNSNYYEITTHGNQTQGYYYDNNGAGGTYTGINTKNTLGTLPVPTVTLGCTGTGDTSITSATYHPIVSIFLGQVFVLVEAFSVLVVLSFVVKIIGFVKPLFRIFSRIR